MTLFAECARQAAGLACGILQWRADDFWAATPADLLIAVEGCMPGAADPGTAGLREMMKRDANG